MPIVVTTETDIPTVFHVEVVEVAEAGTAVEGDEGVAVGFLGVVSDEEGCAGDRNVEARDGVDTATAGSVSEDKVWVCEGEDVKVYDTVDEAEELLVVGLVPGEKRTSPGPGKRTLVAVVES